jgi:hypothetical protein
LYFAAGVEQPRHRASSLKLKDFSSFLNQIDNLKHLHFWQANKSVELQVGSIVLRGSWFVLFTLKNVFSKRVFRRTAPFAPFHHFVPLLWANILGGWCVGPTHSRLLNLKATNVLALTGAKTRYFVGIVLSRRPIILDPE